MLKKVLWFLAFALTGTGLLLLSLPKISAKSNKLLLVVIGILFFIGLIEHFKEIQGRRE